MWNEHYGSINKLKSLSRNGTRLIALPFKYRVIVAPEKIVNFQKFA